MGWEHMLPLKKKKQQILVIIANRLLLIQSQDDSSYRGDFRMDKIEQDLERLRSFEIPNRCQC